MTTTLPSGDAILVVLQLKFITGDQPHIVTLVREHKVGDTLVTKASLPPHANVPLSLGLLELPIIVSLKLD